MAATPILIGIALHFSLGCRSADIDVPLIWCIRSDVLAENEAIWRILIFEKVSKTLPRFTGLLMRLKLQWFHRNSWWKS